MWIDKRCEFTASLNLQAGTTAVGDYFNAGGDFDLGPGAPLYFNMVLLTAANAAASETYTFNLQTDDNSSFSSATTILTFTVPKGTAAGTKYSFGLPFENEKYIRLQAVLVDGGGDADVTIAAWLSDTPVSAQRVYADNVPD